jgi:long-chain acyl-CoA synthetase
MGEGAVQAIEAANAQLAEFQKIRRWVLWHEPDLPRTSTGKVRRRAVAEELERRQQAAAAGQVTSFGAASDWLLALIAEVSGEVPRGVGDELRLTEDLLLDSLGRIQLAAAIEQRMGTVAAEGALERAETLGELRALIAGRQPESIAMRVSETAAADLPAVQVAAAERGSYLYPTWPWTRPMRWLRAAFVETAVRPLVGLLAAPRFAQLDEKAAAALAGEAPLLIVSNHVSSGAGWRWR